MVGRSVEQIYVYTYLRARARDSSVIQTEKIKGWLVFLHLGWAKNVRLGTVSREEISDF